MLKLLPASNHIQYHEVRNDVQVLAGLDVLALTPVSHLQSAVAGWFVVAFWHTMHLAFRVSDGGLQIKSNKVLLHVALQH